MKPSGTKRRHILAGLCEKKKVTLPDMEIRPSPVQRDIVCPFCGYVIPRTMLNTLRFYGKRCGHCEAIILEKIAYKAPDVVPLPKPWTYAKDETIRNRLVDKKIKEDVKELYGGDKRD